MKPSQQIKQYLERLGIAPEVSALYLELAKHQQPSVLQLAKILGISRTQVYRQLDILQDYGLVSAEKLDHTVRYRSLPLDNVEAVIATRQAELGDLRQNLDNMAQLVRDFVADAPQKTATRHYYGVAGLKQANWNLTRAEGEYRVFEAAHLPQHFDEAFARRCNARLAERKLVSYDLTNKRHVNLDDLAPYNLECLHYRYIDPAILTINFEMYIYNDIVTLLDYDSHNMHAIEIQHPTLHAMMRQVHIALWGMGQPVSLT